MAICTVQLNTYVCVKETQFHENIVELPDDYMELQAFDILEAEHLANQIGYRVCGVWNAPSEMVQVHLN